MNYTPQKNKTAKWISFAAAIVACLFIMTTVFSVPYKVVYEVIALLFYIFSFELLFRFVMTEFTYRIEDDNFIVIKRTGKKRICVCNISMKTAAALIRTPKTKEEKTTFAERFGRVKIRYNYCQVINPGSPYSYLFDFNGELAEIVFEPNDEMRQYIEAQIESEENFAE